MFTLFISKLLFQSIRRFEASKARLETQEQMLVKRLERETKQNEELKLKGLICFGIFQTCTNRDTILLRVQENLII